MLRNRFLILLGVCFLAASAAWADDVGYVDCSNHSDDTQVFAKARKTPDVVASVPCGERFTILVYGFVFSRIQTKDGQVGFIYSSLIAIDRSATAVRQTGSVQLAADKTKIPGTRAAVAQPAPPAPAQPQPTQAQLAPAPAPASVPVSPGPTLPAGPTANAPETTATVAQPSPATSTQPDATLAEPAAPAIRPVDTRATWEKPLPPSVRRAPLLEFFGGYAFARFVSAGTATNFNGALGSFGWNPKPWLQIVGDTSYSVVTVSGTKNVIYGNHFGPRFFRRGRNRWGITPFVEALVGGSRADTTVSGTGGYKTSTNCISYKAGGGLDIHPSRHFDIRLFDVDYYRTSFGTNVYQNNYWVSAGVVLRLFGGRSE